MTSQTESDLVQRLRRGEEAAFEEVFDAHHAMLVRLALSFVKDHAVAEEVAQDTWLAAMDAIEGFEGRSTLKTWLARIAINRAKTLATRNARVVPLDDEDSGTVDSERFGSIGQFKARPERWAETPEALLSKHEIRAAIDRCLETLPEVHRAVVTLRDLEGWSSDEVCNALDISESNQRVLLHRGRGRLRTALEMALDPQSRRKKTEP